MRGVVRSPGYTAIANADKYMYPGKTRGAGVVRRRDAPITQIRLGDAAAAGRAHFSVLGGPISAWLCPRSKRGGARTLPNAHRPCWRAWWHRLGLLTTATVLFLRPFHSHTRACSRCGAHDTGIAVTHIAERQRVARLRRSTLQRVFCVGKASRLRSRAYLRERVDFVLGWIRVPRSRCEGPVRAAVLGGLRGAPQRVGLSQRTAGNGSTLRTHEGNLSDAWWAVSADTRERRRAGGPIRPS